MIYQLATGKIIEITVEQYLEMTDEELEYLIAYNYGELTEDPWFGSVLSNGSNIKDDEVPDVIDISEMSKLKDLDIDEELEE